MSASRLGKLMVIALALSGCETFKSFFPDKQQDYRYSQEIAPLALPEEFQSDAIKMDNDIAAVNPTAAAASGDGLEVAPLVTTDAATERPSESGEYATDTMAADQGLISWTSGSSRFQINDVYERAWMIVSKALSRKAIEVTDHDREQGVFYVRYDPQKYEIRDDSILDEVAFIFGYRDSNEQPYRIRVMNTGGDTTEVIVTDGANMPVNQEAGLSLVRLIYETIKADSESKAGSGGDTTDSGATDATDSSDTDVDSSAEDNADDDVDSGSDSKEGADTGTDSGSDESPNTDANSGADNETPAPSDKPQAEPSSGTGTQ